MARNHTDITQLEEVDMREVAQKPCLNLEGIIEESCLEPINSDDYWLFKCRIEDYRNRRCPLCKGTAVHSHGDYGKPRLIHDVNVCLLYTSDAADDTPCVDLGGRRIIKKIFFFKAEDGIRD